MTTPRRRSSGRGGPRLAPEAPTIIETPLDENALNAPVAWRELPDTVKRQRAIAGLENQRAMAVLRPRMEQHLRAYTMVLDALDEAHGRIADKTDLDLEADSRQAAVWMVAGACIGSARAALALLGAGFGAEAVTQERAAHEATRLLGALADEGEPELLRRWLDDGDRTWVRPYETRDADERQRTRLREAMTAAKDEALAAGNAERVAAIDVSLQVASSWNDAALSTGTRQVYDVMSRVGHSRRSGISHAVSAELRQMATGPHPDPRIRAEYVDHGGLIVEEIAIAVGDALDRFHKHDWYTQEVWPLILAIAALRDAAPLI